MGITQLYSSGELEATHFGKLDGVNLGHWFAEDGAWGAGAESPEAALP